MHRCARLSLSTIDLDVSMNPVAQTSANATFQGGASAPMDIGALAADLWKGKGKGKKGKGKGKGKDFSKSSGKGNQHWNFMKGKGKGKGKGKPTSSSTSVCWSCGKTGHFASNCPNYRVSAVEGEELYPSDDAGERSHFGEDDWSDWTEWAINAATELYNDTSSWDQTWDDPLWSWDTWSWDASWDPWGWSSDFTSDVWPTTSEAAPSAKAETLAKPQEEASSSSGTATLPVSAMTLEGPPGLSAPKAKPKAKASISPSTLLMSAVVLGNFGLGNTFRVDGMTDGVVDFSIWWFYRE